jgi:hypothetical protein
MSIFNSGRTERAHCANPKPFIDPGMSFWLNTTSIGRAVFRNTVNRLVAWPLPRRDNRTHEGAARRTYGPARRRRGRGWS